MKYIVHWSEAEQKHRVEGDISSRWTFLGEAAGSVTVGVRRVEVDPGKRATPVHVHGAEEEIFYVLGGSGLLWQAGAACEVRQGDCIVHLPATEAHTLCAGTDGLDVLAFGTRVPTEVCLLPRAGMAWAGPTVVEAPGIQDLWTRDAAQGPLQFPPPGARFANVAARNEVPARRIERGRTCLTTRALGEAAGSRRAGLNHVTLAPSAMSYPQHCHSAEEELFVVLEGTGFCRLDEEEIPVRRGHVVSRPAATRVAHQFEAGADGLTDLAYGTHESNDIAFYPRSGKVYLRGIGVMGRIELLDYWDDEA